MQKRGVMAEIAEKEANAAESQADAQKAAAEAAQTQMETMLQSGQMQQFVQAAVESQVRQILAAMQPQPPQPAPMPMGQF